MLHPMLAITLGPGVGYGCVLVVNLAVEINRDGQEKGTCSAR